MRIALYGGTGMIGSRIAREAVSRDHVVTAISRTPGAAASKGIQERKGDAADADDVARIAAEHDVVVSAIGPSRTGVRHQVFLHAIAILAENVGTRRLIVVGGAGSLEVAPGLRLIDAPGFPEAAKQEAQTQIQALELLRDKGALLDWVYVSPAPFIAPGERTGTYRVGVNAVFGEMISAEDYAVAIVDEIELPRARHARIAVAY
ncbi:MAG: NAD(P)H-binding protein [Nocardioidaceae bacterium]|nr:NAD(P)H-binding protein [Nocardioidaceae bacterium]